MILKDQAQITLNFTKNLIQILSRNSVAPQFLTKIFRSSISFETTRPNEKSSVPDLDNESRIHLQIQHIFRNRASYENTVNSEFQKPLLHKRLLNYSYWIRVVHLRTHMYMYICNLDIEFEGFLDLLDHYNCIVDFDKK